MLTTKKLLSDKKYDLLLVLELEAERLHPERNPGVLIGQLILLYDLIPQNELHTMLMTVTELRSYFNKFLKKEKGIITYPTLRFIHHWGFDKIEKASVKYHAINSKHKLKLLDE